MSDYNEYADNDCGMYYDYYGDIEYENCMNEFYEFLYEMKKSCMPPRTYNPPSNLKTVHSFWEVG